ncbi:MAG: hypothetical protein IAE79_14220 [Anaerolinea sp.]|nr:hypothetical protein [Anaerolinea sp.]
MNSLINCYSRPGTLYKTSQNRVWISALTLFTILFLGCSAPVEPPSHLINTAVPAQSDWVDCGTILSAGMEGEWDLYLWGGFANSVVKKDGIYYLYYQGANGYDEDEETVTWRSIGVATSTDGVHFTKYEHNPVLTWFPGNQLEEGAVSAGAFLDENGDIAIYYGANTWAGGSEVNADGRFAIAPDGFNFTDLGKALDHTDDAIWGSGDELFPIIGFYDNGRWFTYYIPNGTLQRRKLGVAWGLSWDTLENSSAARSGGSTIPVWGTGGYARLDNDIYALFLNNLYGPTGPTLEVRTVSLSDPDSFSAPLQSYQFDNASQATVTLDHDLNTWFMYYRSSDHDRYGVRVASANGQAVQCPNSAQLYLPLIGRQGGSNNHTSYKHDSLR